MRVIIIFKKNLTADKHVKHYKQYFNAQNVKSNSGDSCVDHLLKFYRNASVNGILVFQYTFVEVTSFVGKILQLLIFSCLLLIFSIFLLKPVTGELQSFKQIKA